MDTLAEVCAKTDWQIHAHCLMPYHLHLIVETPEANLVAGMKWFLGTDTGRYNRRHDLCGHLFSGRYKALVVDSATPGYLKSLCEYVHLNPVRADLMRAEEPLGSFAWSSFPEHLKSPRRRSPWLRVNRLLGEHGIPQDCPEGRKMFAHRIEERRRADGQLREMTMTLAWITRRLHMGSVNTLKNALQLAQHLD